MNQHSTPGNSSSNKQDKDNTNSAFNLNLDFLDKLQKEANEKFQQADDAKENIGLFLVRSANQWMEDAKNRPIPNMLFYEFWYEGEVCILFADSNLGKSILAVQIGEAISKIQTVLYFDFELSDKQFENRYSTDYKDHFIFDEKFLRVEINPDMVLPEKQSFEDYLYKSLEQAVIKTGTKVLIIDNITYLKNETEKAKDALPLMKQLKALKKKYGLSILALAHTPKRDTTKPLTMNDLSGSKTLMNFCDSSFAIGESQLDKNLRYIKQIKVRQKEFMYDAENICIHQIEKIRSFLRFNFVSFGKEKEHLKEQTEKDVCNIEAKIVEMDKAGDSLREIAKVLGISHMKVKRILDAKKV